MGPASTLLGAQAKVAGWFIRLDLAEDPSAQQARRGDASRPDGRASRKMKLVDGLEPFSAYDVTEPCSLQTTLPNRLGI